MPETLPPEVEAWAATRPPEVAAVVRSHPPHQCYRGANGRGHYVVPRYGEAADGAVTLKLAHGADSFLPGVEVFGVPPADVVPCGCGDWHWPTDEQRRATDRVVHDVAEAYRNREGSRPDARD